MFYEYFTLCLCIACTYFGVHDVSGFSNIFFFFSFLFYYPVFCLHFLVCIFSESGFRLSE